MQTVYVVIKWSYSDGMLSFPFWNEEDANRYLRDNMKYEKRTLIEAGYTPIVKDNSIVSKEDPDNVYFYYWIDETEIN